MNSGLGCLFIFIFGFIFFLVAVVRTLLAPFFKLFGGYGQRSTYTGGFNSGNTGAQRPRGASQKSNANNEYSDADPHAGNAHHSNANSRQRRKIFAKEEGNYVDFEEV